MDVTIHKDAPNIRRWLWLLGNPTRLKIFTICQTAEYSISQLATMLKKSQPYITQNVISLEEYGLVGTKRGDGHATKVVRSVYSRIIFDFTLNTAK